MSDQFTEFAGPYVLGALSEEDRTAFEQHITGCAECAASVQELAGMPTVLAEATVTTTTPSQGGTGGAGERPEPGAPPEPDVLPALVAKVRRVRRRQRVVVAGSLVACIAVAAVLASLITGSVLRQEVHRMPMSALAEAPVSGAVAIEATASGTRVDMTCRYSGGRGSDYLLVAVRRDGNERTLARWYAVPEDTATIRVPTKIRTEQIDALEVRLPSGRPVLRLTR